MDEYLYMDRARHGRSGRAHENAKHKLCGCGVVFLCRVHSSSAKEMLLCKRCGVTKPREEFEKTQKYRKGLLTECRICLFPKCANCGTQSKNWIHRGAQSKEDWYCVLYKNIKNVDPRT